MSAPILILGATGGIGSALARTLAADGQPVHLAGRNADKLAPLAEELRAPYATFDAMDTGGIEQCVAQAAEAAGGTLDGLAYCVGSIVLKPLKSSKDEDFLEAYRLNALGAAAALRAGTKPLTASERPGGGAALLFSTIAVSQGFTNHGVIAAAKGAVEGLTTAIAADWAPKARVNAIAPSLTRTDMAAPMLQNDRMAEAIAGMHPIPRLGEPQDIAGLGAFLLSDRASWITGQIYGVDGGRSRLRPKG